jgi:hypothetical protein
MIEGIEQAERAVAVLHHELGLAYAMERHPLGHRLAHFPRDPLAGTN